MVKATSFVIRKCRGASSSRRMRPHLFQSWDENKKILATGSLRAMLAAARLLLNATDQEIDEIREIHTLPITG